MRDLSAVATLRERPQSPQKPKNCLLHKAIFFLFIFFILSLGHARVLETINRKTYCIHRKCYYCRLCLDPVAFILKKGVVAFHHLKLQFAIAIG